MVYGSTDIVFCTVGELKKQLEGIDDEIIVVLARDGDGDEFRPLESISTQQAFVPESKDNRWTGDVWNLEDEELTGLNEFYNCITLWPAC